MSEDRELNEAIRAGCEALRRKIPYTYEWNVGEHNCAFAIKAALHHYRSHLGGQQEAGEIRRKALEEAAAAVRLGSDGMSPVDGKRLMAKIMALVNKQPNPFDALASPPSPSVGMDAAPAVVEPQCSECGAEYDEYDDNGCLVDGCPGHALFALPPSL